MIKKPASRYKRRRWSEKFTRLWRAASLIEKETSVIFESSANRRERRARRDFLNKNIVSCDLSKYLH
jgi:hypothetical protein